MSQLTSCIHGGVYARPIIKHDDICCGKVQYVAKEIIGSLVR